MLNSVRQYVMKQTFANQGMYPLYIIISITNFTMPYEKVWKSHGRLPENSDCFLITCYNFVQFKAFIVYIVFQFEFIPYDNVPISKRASRRTMWDESWFINIKKNTIIDGHLNGGLAKYKHQCISLSLNVFCKNFCFI